MPKIKYHKKVRRDLSKGDNGDDVFDIQSAIDLILDQHKFGWRKVIRDKNVGPATIKEAHFAGWLLGFSRKRLNHISKGLITKEDQKYLRREWKVTAGMAKRDKRRKKRVVELRQRHKESQKIDPDGDGLDTFEGVTVDAAFISWLRKARKAGWVGTVVSGYRTPAYSESLCYQMCGSPSCPGRCAGRSSRHAQKDGNGAVDVSDYTNFGFIMKKLGAPFYNALGAADPVHFSRFGN